MHLFQDSTTIGYFDMIPRYSFDSEEDLITEFRISHRLLIWKNFFEDYPSFTINFSNVMIPALSCMQWKNKIFQSQTEYEFDISKYFLNELVKTKEHFVIANADTARKLLYISLFYSRYHAFFRRPLREGFRRLKTLITPKDCDELFIFLLSEDKDIKYTIVAFEDMHQEELEFHLKALTRKNFTSAGVFEESLSEKERLRVISEVYSGPVTPNRILFIKSTAAILLERTKVPRPILDTFRATSNFESCAYSIVEYLNFWESALLLIDRAKDLDGFNFIDTLDYVYMLILEDDNPMKIKRFTPKSLLRRVRNWHEQVFYLETENFAQVEWSKHALNSNIEFKFKSKTYRCIQILNATELYEEGQELEHCVVTYALRCKNNQSHIWSLRIKSENGFQRLITIEEIKGVVVQARVKENGFPDALQISVIEEWAKRLSFRVDLMKDE